MQCLVFNTVAFVLLGLGRARAAETDASETMHLTAADDPDDGGGAPTIATTATAAATSLGTALGTATAIGAAPGGDSLDSTDLLDSRALAALGALPPAAPAAPAASVGAIVLATIVDLRKNLFLVAVLLGLLWRVCLGDAAAAPRPNVRASDPNYPSV